MHESAPVGTPVTRALSPPVPVLRTDGSRTADGIDAIDAQGHHG